MILDGVFPIVVGHKGMSFCDYLSYEMAAKCLFEIVQDGFKAVSKLQTVNNF